MAEVAQASSFQSLLLQLERQHAKEAGTAMVPQLKHLKRLAHGGSKVAQTLNLYWNNLENLEDFFWDTSSWYIQVYTDTYIIYIHIIIYIYIYYTKLFESMWIESACIYLHLDESRWKSIWWDWDCETFVTSIWPTASPFPVRSRNYMQRSKNWRCCGHFWAWFCIIQYHIVWSSHQHSSVDFNNFN